MKEALKLALEAAEDFADVIKYDNEQDDIGSEACCGVLSYHPHWASCKAKQAITAIEAALAQPAQEPVAKYIGECSDGSLVQLYEDVKKDTDFYTAPQQRPWVNLTGEQRDAITEKVIGFNNCCGWEDDYAKAIEAKLKELNQ